MIMGLLAARPSRWSVPHPSDPSITCNIHRRVMDGSLDEATALLAQVGTADDTIWPTRRWPAMLLDNGLAVDSLGGHGSVRYRVAEVESHRVRFVFTSDGPFDGEHTFVLAQPQTGQVAWLHHLDISSSLPGWALDLVVKLHDALLEDLFDNVQAQLSGKPWRPRPFTPRFALLQQMYRTFDTER